MGCFRCLVAMPIQEAPARATVAARLVQGAALAVPRLFTVEIGHARLAAGDLLGGGFAEERVDGWEGGSDEGDA